MVDKNESEQAAAVTGEVSGEPTGAPTRRRLLQGIGAGSFAAFGMRPASGAGADCQADQESDGTLDSQPFYGPRQAGVVTPQPAAALLASFDVLANDHAGLEKLLHTLTKRIALLTQGGPAPTLDARLPPADSGLLGPQIYPDNLTMTVAVGASLFDDRFGIAPLKPRHLITMEQFPNDALDRKSCHGDLMLQICSNTSETNIHALRDVIKNLPDLLALRWKLDGFLPPHTIKRAGKDTVRNLLGFKDGTANLAVSDSALMERMVWVQPASDEPAWTAGGSYQVVRIIRNLVERWDRTPLAEQQRIIGRNKMSGAPLGMNSEHDVPAYASNPQDESIARDAHIRLAE
jgi:deferrochelatase/peroxidase EfeB